MKPILVFPAPLALETPKSVFLKPTFAVLSKKTIFIMRIAGLSGISHFGDDIRRKIYISKRIR
ncbi:MAG: hypothetical protein ACK5WL_15275 [Pseudanabaena sp.]